jgi:WhiB family transcriptional regulator, redox-sensing transcriptional regulator
MTIAVHRPARPVASLQGESDVPEDLPRLPDGATLDLVVLNNAACSTRPELFHPEPGDVKAERAAKRLCGRCPVQWECLKMALATNDEHAIMGGTTPAERSRLRSSYKVSRWRGQSREQVLADQALAETFRQARVERSRLFQDASAAVRAHELACQVGVWRTALALGLNNSDELVEVLEHWGLPPVPRRKQRSTVAEDRAATTAAFELVNQIGWYKAGQQLHTSQKTLRAAFATWGLGEPAGKPWQEAREFRRDRSAAEDALRLAVELGTDRAAEQLQTTRATPVPGVGPVGAGTADRSTRGRQGSQRAADRPQRRPDGRAGSSVQAALHREGGCRAEHGGGWLRRSEFSRPANAPRCDPRGVLHVLVWSPGWSLRS